MSTLRIWWVVLVALAIAAPGPAATAAPTGTPTSILNVVVADAPPTLAGTRAEALGVLRASGTGLVGEPVRLQMRPYGSATFTTVATAISGSAGNLRIATPVLVRTTEFRWVYDGDATYDPTTSGTWAEPVSARVRIRVSDRTPRTGQRIVVRGHTYPARPGRVVSLWRGTKPVLGYCPVTHHTRLARGHVRADGSYRLVVRFATAGDRRLYVRVGGGDGSVVGFSRYRWVHVG